MVGTSLAPVPVFTTAAVPSPRSVRVSLAVLAVAVLSAFIRTHVTALGFVSLPMARPTVLNRLLKAWSFPRATRMLSAAVIAVDVAKEMPVSTTARTSAASAAMVWYGLRSWSPVFVPDRLPMSVMSSESRP
jgi:hypothetical protein